MGKILVPSLFTILLVHFLGLFFGWYDEMLWFDIPMHLAGGGWIGLLFIYLSEKYLFKFEEIHFFKILILTLSFVILVGVFWEFYEYLSDVYILKVHTLLVAPNPKTLPDTLADLVNDLIGGAAALGGVYLVRRGAKPAPSLNRQY